MFRYHVTYQIPNGRSFVSFSNVSFELTKEQFLYFDSIRWFCNKKSRYQRLSEPQKTWLLDARLPILSDEEVPNIIAASDFIRVANNCLNLWKPLIGTHEFLKTATTEKIAAKILLAERCYFTYAAPRVLESLLMRFPRGAAYDHLMDYYNSEKDHYIELAKEIGELNPTELFTSSIPSEGLQMLISSLELLSQKNVLSFVVCLSYFELAANVDVSNFYERIEKAANLSTKSFLNHAKEDQSNRHDAIWKKVLTSLGTEFSKEALDQLVCDLHLIKHAIDNWHSSMLNQAEKLKLKLSTEMQEVFRPGDFLTRKPTSSDFW